MYMNTSIVLAAVAALSAANVFACTGFVAGKRATATGRVIVSHNEDNLVKHTIRYALIPAGAPLFNQPGRVNIPPSDRAYSCFWSELKASDGNPNPGDIFYNEKGVMVYSNNGGVCREWEGVKYSLPEEGRWSECSDGGLGINLRFAAAQRARTAAEAVSIMTNLVATYGYEPLSRNFTVADKDEVWLVQVVHGRRYVARRVPDDEVAAYPNCLTIGKVRPGDLRSPGILAKGDDFDFAAFYQGPRTWKSLYNVHRGLDFYRLAAGLDVKAGESYPFSLKPAHAIAVADAKRGLSSHYEGMPYEVRARHPPRGHGGAEPICRYNTLESMVFEFGETPSEGVFHVATGQPCKTPYVSFHPFGGDLPPFVAIGEEALNRVGDHFRQ